MKAKNEKFKQLLGPYDYRPGFIYLTILVFNLSNLRAYTFDYEYGIERVRFFFIGLAIYATIGLPLFLVLKLSQKLWGMRRKSQKAYLLEVLFASLITIFSQMAGQRFLLPLVNTVNFLHGGVFIGEFVTRFLFAVIFVAITHNRLRVLSVKLESASALNTELNYRYGQLIELDEAIRSHASQLLHDRIQSKLMLSGAKLTRVSELLNEEGRLGIQPVIKELEQIRSIEVPEVSQLLTPNLAGEGLIGSCENLCREFQPEVKFAINIAEKCEDLDEEIRLGLYRIIEQGVINSIKHGPATHVEIIVNEHELGSLILEIKDNGPGSSTLNFGKGTVVIDAWVSKLGGRKEIKTVPGTGFALRVRIP